MKITVTYLDEQIQASEVTHYFGLSDRIAFERRYHVPANRFFSYFDDEWKLTFSDEAPEADYRQEWGTFFAWRALSRALSGKVPEFDAFIDAAARIEVGSTETADDEEEDEEAGPLGEVRQLGS